MLAETQREGGRASEGEGWGPAEGIDRKSAERKKGSGGKADRKGGKTQGGRSYNKSEGNRPRRMSGDPESGRTKPGRRAVWDRDTGGTET